MSFSIDIDASDFEREWREKTAPVVERGIVGAVRNACEEGAREAVNTRIYQDRTANLTASIHGDEGFVITPDGAEGQLTAYMPYASYVNEWEADQQAGEGFMDRGAAKAENVLTTGIERAVDNLNRG